MMVATDSDVKKNAVSFLSCIMSPFPAVFILSNGPRYALCGGNKIQNL